MKKKSLFIVACFLINAFLFGQTSVPPGVVSGTWTLSGSPYLVEGELDIPNQQTLLIEPGVRVEFQGHYKFNVNGRLVAEGTLTDTIVFTITDTAGFSNPDTTLGGWRGIRFNYTPTTNDSSKFMYCKFEYGKSSGDEWADRQGGAIFINSVSKIKISNCLFINNRAGGSGSGGGFQGGALYANVCDLKVENCTFMDNLAISQWGAGGAIAYSCDTTYTGNIYQVILKNNVFKNNSALTRAGVYINNWGGDGIYVNAVIEKCAFIGNGSFNYTAVNINHGYFMLSECIFRGNTAWQYAAAGGFSAGSIGTVTNCLFDSNIANLGNGGHNSGGLSIWSSSRADIMNCTFVNNSASYGAGITVANGAEASVTNSIFWGNSFNQVALSSLNDLGGTLDINYCNLQHGEDSVNVTDQFSVLNWGVGNIDEDPLFIDPVTSDFHLQETSPCAESAVDSIAVAGIWLYSPAYDLEGTPRPNPAGTLPDMGAYETPPGMGVGIDNPIAYESQAVHALYENYPNPFGDNTVISFEVSSNSNVSITLYDTFGKTIKMIVNQQYPAGTHSVQLSGYGLAAGLYFYTFQVDHTFTQTKKLLVRK